jgi:phage gpG-like protein
MTNEESKREMERIIREATLAIHDKIPRAIAVLAKNHYRNNFRLGGFDGKPWKTTWRQQLGVGAEKGYKPLTSKTLTLMNSIDTKIEDTAVHVLSDLDYSLIHNEGGDIPVTRKMRRFFWAKFYAAGGKGAKDGKIPPLAKKWLYLALAAQGKKKFKMPKRMYIGESNKLNDVITKKIESIIYAIINGTNNAGSN